MSSDQGRHIQNTVKRLFKVVRFANRIMRECRCATRNFLGQGGRFVELGHLIKISSEVFLLDTLKTTFWMENLTHWWTQSGPFFQKSRHFFRFSKRAGKAYAGFQICLIMAPYASIMSEYPQYVLISLNMPEHGWILQKVPEYAWKCLNKLFWLCQGSQYATL